MATWADNSVDLVAHWTAFHVVVCFLVFFLSSIVLCHSYYQHKTNYSTVRILTEIAASLTIVATMLIYRGFRTDGDVRAQKLLINVVVYSVLRPMIQACDNFVVYSIYVLIANLTPLQKSFVAAYVAGPMILSYTLFLTLLPLSFDMNTPTATAARAAWSCAIYCLAYCAFYIAFALKLRKVLLVKQNDPELSIAKNLLHAAIGCIGGVMSALEVVVPAMSPIGTLLQLAGTVLSLHLLFNSLKTRPSQQSSTADASPKGGPPQVKYARIAPMFWPRSDNHAEVKNHSVDQGAILINFDNIDDIFDEQVAVTTETGSVETSASWSPPLSSAVGVV